MLSIDNILQFLPDFVVVETFKSEICLSLEQYNKSLNTLRAETEDYKRNSISIQDESSGVCTRSLSLPTYLRCSLSGAPVIAEPFFYFMSGHAYLERKLREKKMDEEPSYIQTRDSEAKSGPREPNSPIECPLSGTAMINSIDIPLCRAAAGFVRG